MYVRNVDQETVRLIITASAAIVAGLGGAGLTAWINRKNTVQSLAAAADRDHATWLRSQKQEAYAEFLAKAESVIHQTANHAETPVSAPALEDMSISRGKLALIGGPDAIELSRMIDFEARTAFITRMQMERAPEGSPEEMMEWGSLMGRVSDYHSLVGKFVDSARNEMGAGPGPRHSGGVED